MGIRASRTKTWTPVVAAAASVAWFSATVGVTLHGGSAKVKPAASIRWNSAGVADGGGGPHQKPIPSGPGSAACAGAAAVAASSAASQTRIVFRNSLNPGAERRFRRAAAG